MDRVNPRWVLTACCLGQGMVVLDMSVMNVALPVVRDALGFTSHSLQWVFVAYTVVFSGCLLLGGRLADLFGQQRIFLVGITVFTLASLLGGLAHSAFTLIAARSFQGLGAAIMAPATLTVLGTTFTDPVQRAKAFGLWGAVSGMGGAVGVVASGIIIELLSWRWILLVNVPIGIGLWALTARAVPPGRRPSQPRRLDLLGALSVTCGLVALVYGIVHIEQSGIGAPITLGSLGLGGALLALFVVDQSRIAAQPLAPLGFFRHRSVWTSNLVRLVSGAALGGTFYFFALLLQRVLGYSPLQAGLAYLPLSLAVFVGARGMAGWVHRFGPRPVLIAGLLIPAAGLAWLAAADADAGFAADLLGPSALVGLGMGMIVTASTAAGTANLPWHQAGLASGVLNTTRQMGDAIGVTMLVAMANAAVASQADHAHGYRVAFLVAAGLMLASLPAALAVPGQIAATSAAKSQPYDPRR